MVQQVLFYTNLTNEGDYESFKEYETTEAALLDAAAWLDAGDHSVTIYVYGETYKQATDWQPWLAGQLEKFDYLRDTEPTTDKYANLPAISGGEHDHKPSPNRATSQKRDDQRAARDMQREQYRIAAESDTANVAGILADLGFTVASTHESGDTLVTIWHDADGLATIKQTPYTIKFYNGRPIRMRKSAESEFVKTVEFGWQRRGDRVGYVAGIAEAFAAYIAYDDTLGGYGYIDTAEQSPAVDPEPPANAYTIATDTGAVIAQVSHIDATETANDAATARAIAILNMAETAHNVRKRGKSNEEIAAVIDRHLPPVETGDLLTVTASGERIPVTVSHDGPWQADPWNQCPTISGGSHDHDAEPETIQYPDECQLCENVAIGETGYCLEHMTCPLPPGVAVTGYEDCIINHSPEDGTTIDGNTRPYKDIIKAHGFRWGRTLTAWYLPNSRDQKPDPARINPVGEALKAAGARVTMNLDHSAPDPDTAQRERIAATVATLPPCEHDTPEALAAAILAAHPLSVERANAAHQWSSFSPEKRAAGHLADYAATIERAAAGLWPHATTPEQRAILAAKLDDFARMYNERYTAWLSALSRTASTMITGGSGFNHRRNGKALDIERRRCEELNEWTPAALKRILKALDAARTPEQAADATFNALRKEIDKDLTTIQEIERGQSHCYKSAFTTSIAGRIQRAHKRGELDAVRRALAHLDAEQTRRGIKGITKRHSIWKLAAI